MIWYKQNEQQLFENLDTSDDGLSLAEVADRLRKYGPNQLDLEKEPWWKVLLEPFKSVFAIVLLFAMLISLLGHEKLDAIIIGAILLINAVIFYTQQYATNRVLRSLKRHSIQRVSVIRKGEQKHIMSVNLVPGDVVILNEGERVPADARVIHTDDLRIDEASLTGESVPVHKHASTLVTIKQLYEQDNMVFQGTYVLAGSARVLVVETGSRTEFGKIANLTSKDNTKSPVQAKIDSLITLLVKVVGVLAVLVFILSLSRGMPPTEGLRFVLAFTVSAVPEGLPVALTVIIVLGMRRMAKQKALVRSFKAIEDIGLITTIATDKTGTLTKNHLTVVDDWSLGNIKVNDVASWTIDLNNTQTDPLDQAIESDIAKSHRHKVDKLYPFDLSLRMSGTYSKKESRIFIKGSPEHVLDLSKITSKQHKQSESAMHKMASNGYRVIAFAVKSRVKVSPKDLSKIKKGSLEFIGFVAFADELRPEAGPAIKLAHEAGIDVRLITGDHYETAYNIGKQIGLADHPDQVIQGTSLPKGTASLALAIRGKTIFARILPEDKYRILKALKKTEITAMTGDGVNDVPALANAHVGIAMGSGSDIAKDAGGIVLLNDNFATIIKAISEGRKIFDNIRRMIYYLLSTSLGEVLTMIGALLFGLPLPLTAIQILWVNLVTDTAMVLPLGLEPEEDGHMKKPPRQPEEPLLGRILLGRMLLIAMTMAILTLASVYALHKQGYDTVYIQTVAFMMLVSAQWMNAFNARSEYQSLFSRIRKMNYGLVFGFAVAFSLQMMAMFGPLQELLGVGDVPLNTLLFTSGVTMVTIFLVSELHKWGSRAIRSPKQ